MRKMRRGQIMMEYVVLATLIFAVLCGTVTGIVVAHRAGSSMWRGLGWGIAVGVVSPLALGAFALLLPAGLKCIIWVCAGGVLISRVVLGILQAVVIGMINLVLCLPARCCLVDCCDLFPQTELMLYIIE